MCEYPGLRGTTVLVVEDELLQALDTADLLSEAGARVLGPVSTIAEARRRSQGTACSAVILDLQVDDGNCLDLACQLLQAGKAVIVLTGYPPQSVPLHDSAALHVLFKPTPASHLLATLERLVLSPPQQRASDAVTHIAA